MKIKNVTFKNPKNGINGFVPSIVNGYPEGPGIYIYGLKIDLDGEKKFIPLYVGIAKDLQKRLWQHFCEEKSNGNSKWYVFDYIGVKTISDIEKLYNDMKISDSYKGLDNRRFSDKLIWFNNKLFFNHKLKIKSSNYISNTGVLSSILPKGDLDTINTSHSKELKKCILKSKELFDDNFHFIYSNLASDIVLENSTIKLDSNNYMEGRKNGIGKSIAEKVEATTKKKLFDKLGIYTPAKSHQNRIDLEMKLDLSCIQNNLINLTGEPFDNPLIL